jgi:hypothetical protein
MKIILRIALVLAPCSLWAQTSLYWGNTHLHTNFSTDAYTTGNYNISPDDAYRFAEGMPVIQPGTGAKVQMKRPLDFLAISDHDLNFGLYGVYVNGVPAAMTTDRARDWYKRAKAGEGKQVGKEIVAVKGGPKGKGKGALKGKGGAPPLEPVEAIEPSYTPEILAIAWADYVETADRHNKPGKFTAMIAWEWTSFSTPGQYQLHRVVMTPTNAATAKKFVPYNAQTDSNRPEELWNWLDTTSKRLGIDFVSIPHNSNLSNGLMFDMVDSDGRPISAEYARTRMRWEPVVEALQVKGNSETTPEVSPNDEFADFEIYKALLMGGQAKQDAGSYLRSGLMRGLKIEGQTGVNPYKFGFQGGTDGHVGLSTADEDFFFGKTVNDSSPASRGNKPVAVWDAIGWDMSAQGMTGVWAKENTREEIAAAFKRKEVYATSGPRIQVRMFAGFNFAQADANARDIAEVGYRKGVPMGGDLTAAPQGKKPTFLIHSVKDPVGANLDRVQVVKGWLDAKGETHEKIYDVASSGNRKPGADGKLPPVGNTVDLKTAGYTNTIGAPQLATVWTDPDFNPAERAFYYVRVLEIPTPRYSLMDAVALKVDPASTTRPSTIQERAFSSPVWYTPSK